MSVQINGIDIESGLVTIATATDPAIDAAVSSAIVGTYGGVLITLTAAGNAQTLQNPTQIATIKTFTVINNDTSGANTIAVNGITLAAGKSQSFIWDGSAWGPTSLGITAIPVPVVQGGTGSATGNVSGLDMSTPPAIGGTTPAAGSFTTIKMTTGAAVGLVVSDVDGNLVSDATPALGTPASGDLQNCSLAVAPAIGGTTPAAGNFTTLDASGDATFGATTRVTIQGAANQDGIVFGSLGTATKGIDLSGSGLSGSGDYWLYGSANTYLRADGLLNLESGYMYGGSYVLLSGGSGLRVLGKTGGMDLEGTGTASPIRFFPTSGGNIIGYLPSNSAFLSGNSTAVGSLTTCTSNGTTTITKTAHGLSPVAGDLVHVTGATTAADKGFYRYISGDADTLVVDRALSGSDADVALTIYKDVIGIFATDGTNGQRIMNYSHQNKPLQLGGDVLAATGHSLTSEDVLVGGDLEINGQSYFDESANFTYPIKATHSNGVEFGGGPAAIMAANEQAEVFVGLVGPRRIFLITDYANRAKNHDHSDATNPTIFLHSVTDPDTDNTQWISFAHDQTDGVLNAGKGGLDNALAQITVGSGAGITVVSKGNLNRQVYKVTVSYTAFSDVDTTKGVVIATLPAKMKLVGFYSDTTTKFIGGAITAATLEVGITAEGAAEIIAPHDVFTAAVTKGLADADMGTGMTRAAQIQGGYLPSWTGTTEIFATIDTTTANTDALTQGSVTFYIETEQL